MIQPKLFRCGAEGPPGFRYFPDAVSHDIEAAIVASFQTLPFAPFQFHQYTGLRRVVSYGFKYDYSAQRVRRAAPLPDFLLPLRAPAAELSGIAPGEFRQALVTEYAAGAGIGWHRDKPAFEKVVAFSFGGEATLRFRRKSGRGWERKSIDAAPRSAYLLSGAARSEWEHSIPAVRGLRYSITFRNFVEGFTRSDPGETDREI